MPAKKSNIVIVRVWNSGLKGGESVGHISIETPSAYVSLWPDDPRKDKERSTDSRNLGVLGSVQHDFVKSADDDIRNEDNRPPEKIYCLYTLDVSAIEARFNKISTDSDFKGWTLLGDNLLINRGNAHSCASLAYTLLKAGGLYQIISRLHSSRVSSVVTPDQLAEVVKKAKQAELHIEPVTQKFTFSRVSAHGCTENETAVTSQSWSASVTPYLVYGAGFFAVSATVLAVAARNEYCPQVLEDVCRSGRGFTG